MPKHTDATDPVDLILAQWAKERPGLDVSAMAIIGRLSRVTGHLRQRLGDVFAEHDLEQWEFDVLATLLRSGAPYQLTPGELIDSMMVTSGAMTNRLQRLEQRGLITREKSQSDGRQVLVTLTKQGVQVVDAALIDHTANETALISGLDAKQQADLIGLLQLLDQSVRGQR